VVGVGLGVLIVFQRAAAGADQAQQEFRSGLPWPSSCGQIERAGHLGGIGHLVARASSRHQPRVPPFVKVVHREGPNKCASRLRFQRSVEPLPHGALVGQADDDELGYCSRTAATRSALR